MKREEEDDEIIIKKITEKQKLSAYIGLQNVPLREDDPRISIRFPISLRLFCAAFAVSRMEKNKNEG